MSREQFIRDNSHLWGTIDPIDGIPFRPPSDLNLNRRETKSWRCIAERCIYDEPGKSKLIVRVRVFGTLHHVARCTNERDARRARDAFFRRVYGEEWLRILREKDYPSKRTGSKGQKKQKPPKGRVIEAFGFAIR